MSASNAEPLVWDIDRETVICRVFDAPRALVFKVWTDAEHVGKWFGPKSGAAPASDAAGARGSRTASAHRRARR